MCLHYCPDLQRETKASINHNFGKLKVKFFEKKYHNEAEASNFEKNVIEHNTI